MSTDNNEELNKNFEEFKPEASNDAINDTGNKEKECNETNSSFDRIDPELDEAHTNNLYYMSAWLDAYNLRRELKKKEEEIKEAKSSFRFDYFMFMLLTVCVLLIIQSFRVITVKGQIKDLKNKVEQNSNYIDELENKIKENSDYIDEMENAPLFQHPVIEKPVPVEDKEIDMKKEVENEEDNVLET